MNDIIHASQSPSPALVPTLMNARPAKQASIPSVIRWLLVPVAMTCAACHCNLPTFCRVVETQCCIVFSIHNDAVRVSRLFLGSYRAPDYILLHFLTPFFNGSSFCRAWTHTLWSPNHPPSLELACKKDARLASPSATVASSTVSQWL